MCCQDMPTQPLRYGENLKKTRMRLLGQANISLGSSALPQAFTFVGGASLCTCPTLIVAVLMPLMCSLGRFDKFSINHIIALIICFFTLRCFALL